MSEITVRLDYCNEHPGELHMIDERGRHVANDMKSLERRGYRYIRHAGKEGIYRVSMKMREFGLVGGVTGHHGFFRRFGIRLRFGSDAPLGRRGAKVTVPPHHGGMKKDP